MVGWALHSRLATPRMLQTCISHQMGEDDITHIAMVAAQYLPESMLATGQPCWREVQPMGFVTNYCLHPGLQALLAFLSRREALTPIGTVEVLGDFDLAAGPHV